MSKIIGNTTATPNPRPDWAQTDATKADYIKNKPGIATPSTDGLMSARDKEIFNAFGFYTSGDYAEMLTSKKITIETPDIFIDAETPINISTGDQYATISAAEIIDMKNEIGAKAALANYVPTSQKGVAGGVATLDANGKVPSTQLPSYVDDVLEYSAKSSFPTTGETGKIYVDTTTNKTYRWSGSAYIEISASLALGETSSTAYAGDKGKALRELVNKKTAVYVPEKTTEIIPNATNTIMVYGRKSENDPYKPLETRTVNTDENGYGANTACIGIDTNYGWMDIDCILVLKDGKVYLYDYWDANALLNSPYLKAEVYNDGFIFTSELQLKYATTTDDGLMKKEDKQDITSLKQDIITKADRTVATKDADGLMAKLDKSRLDFLHDRFSDATWIVDSSGAIQIISTETFSEEDVDGTLLRIHSYNRPGSIDIQNVRTGASENLSINDITNLKNEIGAKANAFGNANATTYATKYGPAYGGINTTSTGQASTAIGAGVTACSDGAFAAGVLTIAGNPESYTDAKYSGQGAAAFGISNPSQGKFGARGMASFVAGYNTYAKANATAAFGDSTKALGEAAFAAGYLTTAEGNQSFATGRQTKALGNSSAAFGKDTTAHASASGALVAGLGCQAYVDGAVALGYSLVGTQNASNIGQVILGRYNKIENNSTDVLVVGCGTSANDRKNGFAIDANGNSTFGGTITVDGETFTAADIRKMKAFLATIAD